MPEECVIDQNKHVKAVMDLLVAFKAIVTGIKWSSNFALSERTLTCNAEVPVSLLYRKKIAILTDVYRDFLQFLKQMRERYLI